MRRRVCLFLALALAGCQLGRASKAQIVDAWHKADEVGFNPMSPICEKVEGAAASRLDRAEKEFGRLSAVAAKLYPHDAPLDLSPENGSCGNPDDLGDVNSSAYAEQEQEAADRAGRLEPLNAKFAKALGE